MFESNSLILCINLLLSFAYIIASTTVFILLFTLGLISPILITCGSIAIMAHSNGNLGIGGLFFSIIAITGIFIFFITLVGIIRGAVVWLSGIHNGKKCKDKLLNDIVTEVCDEVGIQKFRKVYLTADCNAETYFSITGKNIILGQLVLKYLTENELKSIIAHECAHYHHGSMSLSRIHYITNKLYRNMGEAFVYVFDRSVNEKKFTLIGRFFNIPTSINIAFDLSKIVMVVCMVIFDKYISFIDTLLNDKEYEHYCDLIAASCYGGNVFESALLKLNCLMLAKHEYDQKRARFIENDALMLSNFHFFYMNFLKNNKNLISQSMVMESGTHPTINSRIEKIKRVAKKTDTSRPISCLNTI